MLKVTVDRPTNATDSLSLMREWLYNNRSELAAASIGTNLYGYSYDTIGNRLWSADNVITNEYAANSLNQYTLVGRAAPSAPPISFTYTSDGGLSFDGTWTYAYDAEDQLTSVTSSSLTNGAIRVLNTYDYRRRRTSKTVHRLYSTIPLPPAPPTGTQKTIFDNGRPIPAGHINAYLMDAPDIIVNDRVAPLCDVPAMSVGSFATDGGSLILSAEEREELLTAYPSAETFVRPYVSPEDFINNKPRYCLWLKGVPPDAIIAVPPVRRRIETVRTFRLSSKKAQTRKRADTPTLFAEKVNVAK